MREREEREDLLDEHDDEIDELKKNHDEEMEKLRSQYETQVTDLTDRLKREERKRMQEDGDWTKELEDVVERERDALNQS